MLRVLQSPPGPISNRRPPSVTYYEAENHKRPAVTTESTNNYAYQPPWKLTQPQSQQASNDFFIYHEPPKTYARQAPPSADDRPINAYEERRDRPMMEAFGQKTSAATANPHGMADGGKVAGLGQQQRCLISNSMSNTNARAPNHHQPTAIRNGGGGLSSFAKPVAVDKANNGQQQQQQRYLEQPFARGERLPEQQQVTPLTPAQSPHVRPGYSSSGEAPSQQQLYDNNNNVQTSQLRSRRHLATRCQSTKDRPLATALIRSARSESNLKTAISTNSQLDTASVAAAGRCKSYSSMLSDQELYQIRLMYSSRASCRVVVCTCLANLYFAQRPSTVGLNGSTNNGNSKKPRWDLAATGVPVLLLNETPTRSRTPKTDVTDRRQLTLVLAEKGTGFSLWKDTIDLMSRYTEVGKTFHTLLAADDRSRQTGLSFDSSYSAMQFYQQLKQLLNHSGPPNGTTDIDTNGTLEREGKKTARRHSFHGPSWRGAKLGRSTSSQPPAIRKTDISKPCCFNHVTSIRPHQLNGDFGAAPQQQLARGQKRAVSCIQIGGANPHGPVPTLMASPSQSV